MSRSTRSSSRPIRSGSGARRSTTILPHVSQIGHRDESRTPGIFLTVTETCTGHTHTALAMAATIVTPSRTVRE